MIFSCDHRSRSQRSRSQRQTKDLSHKLYDILQKKKISARMSSMKQIDLFTCHSPCRLQLPPLNFSSPFTPSHHAPANTYRFDSYEPRIVDRRLLLIYVTYLLPSPLCARFLEDFNLVHCAFSPSQSPSCLSLPPSPSTVSFFVALCSAICLSGLWLYPVPFSNSQFC